jgi:hypothetical protein
MSSDPLRERRPTLCQVSALRANMTGMTALPRTRMTVDEYLAWAEGQPGRYELLDGVVFAMSPGRRRPRRKKSSRSCSLALRHSSAWGSLLRPPGRHDRSYRQNHCL